MDNANQGSLSIVPIVVPAKRKRGRPRKDPSKTFTGNRRAPLPTSIAQENGNQPHQPEPVEYSNDAMVGQTVSGVVEAVFDAGYLLNVRVGNTDITLRGVIFKPGRFVPISSQNDLVPNVAMIRRIEIPVPRNNQNQVHRFITSHVLNESHTASHRPAKLAVTKGKQLTASPVCSRGNVVPVLLQPVNLTNGITTASPTPHLVSSKSTMDPLLALQATPFSTLGTQVPHQNQTIASSSSVQNEDNNNNNLHPPMEDISFQTLFDEVTTRKVKSGETHENISANGKVLAEDSGFTLETGDASMLEPLSIEPLQALKPEPNDDVIFVPASKGSNDKMTELFQIIENLYRARWGPEDGVGSIIISPTRELAGQLFDVLRSVGKHHTLSAGLLIGGRDDVNAEKEVVERLNILVCTTGRLLQHMDETIDFDCSQLQVLVLDEADRILDVGFKKALDAIISQIPKYRQTFLFSATQTKSVQDLARLSLKDPEYLSVHEESTTATPSRLQQTAMIVPLEQKMDMLWSFIKAHLNSKILVFLSSCKQVKFVFEAFKKLRPGVPLKCLHGRQKQETRMAIYSQFCDESRSVLFSTDVASRRLDFNQAVDWVVQVDCPENVAGYIHRVGRTARYNAGGRSVLFLAPSEMNMLEKLQTAKIPIQFIKANTKRLQPISGLMAALLVKYSDMQQLAQRAFITYLRSIHIQKDKEIFDIAKLSIEEFSASFGLPMTPKVRFLKGIKPKTGSVEPSHVPLVTSTKEKVLDISRAKLIDGENTDEEMGKTFLSEKHNSNEGKENATDPADALPVTRVLKKKKLKINLHRPVGTRVVFDDEGHTLPPLATIADISSVSSLDKDAVKERYNKKRQEFQAHDKEDKLIDKQRLKSKRKKDKMKLKRNREDEEDEEDNHSGSDREAKTGSKIGKKSKIYFDCETDDKKVGKKGRTDFVRDISVTEQEDIALKILNSMCIEGLFIAILFDSILFKMLCES